MNAKNIILGSLGLGGLLLAWDAWGRTPGDKTVVGDVVRVDAARAQLVVGDEALLGPTADMLALKTALPGGFPQGTFLYVQVTSVTHTTLTGRLVRIQLSDRAIEVKNAVLRAMLDRFSVLPLSYGAKPVPVTTI